MTSFLMGALWGVLWTLGLIAFLGRNA